MGAEDPIKRPRPAAAENQRQKQAGPAEMRRPCVGIHKELDHRGHAKQRQRRGPREQPQDKQNGEKVLRIGRRVRRDFGCDKGQRVIGPEQLVGARLDGQPAFDLGPAGQEEDRGDSEARDQQEKRVGDAGAKPSGRPGTFIVKVRHCGLLANGPALPGAGRADGGIKRGGQRSEPLWGS